MVRGLADYKRTKAEEEARREASQKPKFNRFNLEKDGDSAIVRFAQEIDFDAKGYDEAAGIGFVNVEHTCGDDPKNGWMKRANCTTESQGQCYGCERVSDRTIEWADRKGWKQKERFYINVIAGTPREVVKNVNGNERKYYFATDIDRTTGDGEVYLLEQGTYNGIYDDLGNYFLEEEVSEGTILNKYFKITRKGYGFNDTSYSITPLKEIGDDAKPLSEFELVNIEENALREIPYAQQRSFYLSGVTTTTTKEVSSEGAPAKAAADDDDW